MFFAFIYIDFIIILILLLFLCMNFLLKINKTQIGHFKFKYMKKTSFLLPIFLLGLSFIRYIYLILDIGWAPILDPISHGKYVGLILFHHRIPLTTYPVGNLSFSPFKYPMGFHVLSASVSFITGLYPSLSILIIATMIVIFLPSLLYSIIYIGTNSIELSLIAYLLAYFLPDGKVLLWQPSHDLMLGNFLVGTYPNLMGNIIFLSFFYIILGFNNDYYFKKNFVLYAILTFSLIFVYFPLLPFVILFIILRILIKKINKSKIIFFRFANIFIVLVLLVIFWGIISFFHDKILQVLNINSSFLYEIYERYPLFTSKQYIFYTISILISFFISIWYLFNSKNKELSIIFLVLFIPLVLAQNEYIYKNFLWFIQPDRVFILLVTSSYIINLIGVAFALICVSKLFNWKIKFRIINTSGHERINDLKIVNILLICGVTIFMLPSLMGHFSYSYPSYLKDVLPHGNDLVVMKWLSENTNATDVILNDFSMITTWIPSFKAHDIINDRDILREVYHFHTIDGTWLANRTIECNNIILRPWDYNLTKEMADKYNLKYIYISENDSLLGMYSEGKRYSPIFPWESYSQDERIKFYLSNPYLEMVYKSGNSVVFKIRP